MGLRVADAVCMRRFQVEQALRTGLDQVQSEAKNSRWREGLLSAEARVMLNNRLQQIERGGRVFVIKDAQAQSNRKASGAL